MGLDAAQTRSGPTASSLISIQGKASAGTPSSKVPSTCAITCRASTLRASSRRPVARACTLWFRSARRILG
jgi:hypothetical protein